MRSAAVLLLATSLALAQTPGERPPQELTARVRPAMEAGRRALAAGDAPAVRAAVAEAVAVLGPWAGKPETATRYFSPADPTPFDPAQLRAWWLREIERGVRGLPWAKNSTGDPRAMTAGLRDAAWPLDALARTALLVPEHREALTKHARAGADWLLRLQHPSGVFPFPIGPGLNPREKVGQMVARAIQEHPGIVKDDWIPDDATDGGLQFDHGLCGHALLSAWELTRDARYLAAARRAGAWAAARPLVTNWNYNAFSAGFLAQLARATGDEKFLAAAVTKADAGVLPGQLPGGRWFDAHNACAVYHNILLRELLHVYRALPAAHAFRPVLIDALTRGLDQAAAETLAHGFTGTWTDNFATALRWIGENKRWRDALNACVNAAGRNGAPSLGFAAVAVLELSAASASGAQAAAPRALIPEIASDWWRLCTMPDLGPLNGPDPKKQHIVDHSFIPRPDGKWTLWACLRGTAPGRILFGWEGDSLEKGPWLPLGIVARATHTWGENAAGGANLESGTVPPASQPGGERIGPPEVIQAPHFARLGDTFHCFYNTNGVRLMTSRDGKNFTRVGAPPNGNLLYGDGGRDVMVLPIDGVFHAYSTISTADKRGYIILRTSRDLKTWTPAKNVCEGGRGGVGAVSAESPFVVARDGFYYLFRASSNDATTYIYRSRTPDYFGVNDDANLIATMKVKAPEIIEHGGEWFISDLADFQGLKLAKLKWTAAATTP